MPGEAPGESFTPGELLGERYRIESLLGRGGMGEVWRAWDLKLRLEVALKSLHPRLFSTAAGLELLRDEVRAAREVTSPNVCRLYDLVEIGERELVSMEYVDGVTLLEHLRRQGPLELKEANEIASQLLAGVEAIHQAGLVHRDIKPENVMLTRAGRVVVMDFGLTSPSGTGSLAGTPAYMAPEQARGEPVDARADVFSAGMVLAEMLSAEAGPDDSSRQSFWQAVREDLPVVPESPWKGILERALAPEVESRFASAQELVRALEEVAFRVEGVEHEHPYPGLSSFREEDAEFFFGREAEIEALWKKLRRTHLLGLIGPSGSGKSSFINAGLWPAKPEGWSCLQMTPGQTPFAALGRVLLPELEGDPQALVALEDLASALHALRAWQSQHAHVLLIVDQFEELFTQNAKEVRGRFAELLGRAALDAEIHVLLSMRDDFLFRCQAHEVLRPVFSELTPLGPPTGSALRRAIVQPALRCGYRFEDESIVESMLEEVSRERGALPSIAFTAAQLWERRDRETGYLTSAAYHEIGGVGGALAQHAEATLEQIGEDGIPIVRELFRNLVTAEGTRASRDRKELLSVFSTPGAWSAGAEGLPPARSDEPVGSRAVAGYRDPEDANEVLDTLIDARLLTSYELPDAEGNEHQRIEIVHESLLKAWPRLVRWRTQEAEGAQLRDELRAQAQLWEEHSRSVDYLWTGAAYLDYLAWRERYPGGLTTVEDEFGQAMTRHAERRRRRVRVATAAAIVLLVVVSVVISVFWRRSEEAERQAVTEARRAEAANLYSIAQLRLEDHPTVALAYATASLGLSDSAEVRRFVLDALWRGPTELRIPFGGQYTLDFSPDGEWLVTANGAGVQSIPADGGPPIRLEGGSDRARIVQVSPRGDLLAHEMDRELRRLGVWSHPEGELLRTVELEEGETANFDFSSDGDLLWTSTLILDEQSANVEVRSWPALGGEPQTLAEFEIESATVGTFVLVDPTGSRIIWNDGTEVDILPLPKGVPQWESLARLEHGEPLVAAGLDEPGRRLATMDQGGTVRIWSLESSPPELANTLSGRGGGIWLQFDVSGSMLVDSTGNLWNLGWAPTAEPLQLHRAEGAIRDDLDLGYGIAFHPRGTWVATGHQRSVSLWPLARLYPQVLEVGQAVGSVRFTPDGRWIIAGGDDVRMWPLDVSSGREPRVLYQTDDPWQAPGPLALAADGSIAVIGTNLGRVAVLPLNGGPWRELDGFTDSISGVAVGPRGRFVAAGAGRYKEDEAVVRVWDLETGEVDVLDHDCAAHINHVSFSEQGQLLSGSCGYYFWDLGAETPRLLEWKPQGSGGLIRAISPDGRRGLSTGGGELWLDNLETGTTRVLEAYGTTARASMFAFDGEAIISADRQGVIRIGSIDGGEPHLLLGHHGPTGGFALDVSPDGKWLASGGEDGTIRLWPMPDLDKPPLHTLPRDELLAKLKTLTNLRAIEDPDSASGWKLEIDTFPGWAEVPEW